VARPGDAVVVAFSGGADSTALLSGLVELAPRLGLAVHAAHLDHGLDPGSARRAAAAERLAGRLGIACRRGRLGDSPPAVSREAWARDERYRFLEGAAEALGARFIATAHHAGDQAETVLLRLLFGSGLDGLAAIRARHGRRVRPLLGLDRGALRAHLAARGLDPVEDPTNRDPRVPRNRVRRFLFPLLAARDPDLGDRLGRIAAAAGRASGRLERFFAERLGLDRAGGGSGASVDRRAFEALPPALWPHALGWLHRRAGLPYPAARAARRELLRQLRSGGRVGCDCGDGWRWEGCGERLELVRGEAETPHFTYTLQAPGEVEVRELGLRFRLRRGRVAAWMFTRQARRTALAGPLGAGVEIRSRRPGDRLRPLGSPGTRRLKDVFIDRHLPRRQRDRWPLLVVDGEIAWVPGIAIDERHRLGAGDQEVWIVEIEGNAGLSGRVVSDEAQRRSPAPEPSADRDHHPDER